MPSIDQNYYNISNSVLLDQSVLDVFVLQNLIDQDDADRLKAKFKTNRQIEDFLLKNRVVSRDTINKAYSIILKLPYVELRNVRIPEDLKKLIPERVARKFGIIGFSQDDGMVRIAISRPADIMTSFQSGLKELFEKKKLEVELFITGETDFLEVIKQYRNSQNPLLLKKGSSPVIYLRNQPIPEIYLKKFPIEFVSKYRLVVFGQNQRGHYLVACEDPDSPITMKILDFIKKENAVNLEQFATSHDDIEFVLAKMSGKSDSQADAVIAAEHAEMAKQEADAKNQAASSKKQEISQKSSEINTQSSVKEESKGVVKSLLDTLLAESGPELTVDNVQDDGLSKQTEDRAQVKAPVVDSGSIEENQDFIRVNKEAEKNIDRNLDKAKFDNSGNVGEDRSIDKTGGAKSDVENKPAVPVANLADEKTEDQEFSDRNDLGSLIKEDVTSIKMLEDIAKEGFIPKTVAAIINYSLLARASDIHVEPENKMLRIRCRVDGILQDVINLPIKQHPPFVSRIKIMSKLKIDESRIPQDGRFDVKFRDHEVDVRVSTLPTVHGEKIVMRLLDKSKGILSLEDLGMQGSAFEKTNEAIAKPYGIILSTGPTGSGKSTTLYAVLNRISVPGVNIVTLEDPVEYEIPGINQCQIKPEIGFTFASGLRSILRQDPNVIMVGEIRDAETAAMATHAALTGHLVLSTLHTNDTAGALPRLINMGVEPFLITSSINLVIAQRLVRRICPKCKEEVKIPQKLMDQLMEEMKNIPASNLKDRARIPAEPKLYHGKGCPECSQGFRGRVGIYEVMAITPAIEELAIAKRPANEIKETAIKEGMITMKQDGILKCFEGYTTVDEIFQAVINS